MAPQCSALNISDQQRCEEAATSINGLFCSFHSRQCQAIYKGYKRRNARLDELSRAEPEYLKQSPTALANQTFADVDSESILQEVYNHLSKRLALLDRVIRARKLHHSRFYSLELDYGHQNYLNVLSNQHFLIGRAVERLERRTAEVLYQRRKWFRWVRQLEDDEETRRDNEKKKIKREAALFRRHVKEVQRRKHELEEREDAKRQEAALDEACRRRVAEEDEAADEEDEAWDPIEDVVEDDRGSYIALIKHFLLMVDTVVDDTDQAQADGNSKERPFIDKFLDVPPSNGVSLEPSPTSSAPVKSSKTKKAKNKGNTDGTLQPLPKKSAQDSTEEIRRRLKKVSSTLTLLVITLRLLEKTAPLPDSDIDQLLLDIVGIKQLLFCRLLLSHATLLPAALKASSVEDFLSDKDIADADLRDLCLKIECPGLQEIRDACADFGREEEDEDKEDEDDNDEDDWTDVHTDEDDGVPSRTYTRARLAKQGLTTHRHRKSWAPEREKQLEARRQIPQSFMEQTSKTNTQTFIDFGDVDTEGKFMPKMTRVNVCGRNIHNYPSEKSVPRRGWLQFSVIAKESHLYDVIQLCRSWEEFWELNVLVNFQYFPAAHSLIWKGDQFRSQLLQLGFIPYYQFDKAREMTLSKQTGSRRGPTRQAHSFVELRNFICAHLNRDDPVSRRFLQYISAETSRVITLIRDAKTGGILKTPPDERLWLARQKSGFGRASRTEWDVLMEVGPGFFEKMEDYRPWHFGFNDHYDVYIWDLKAGEYYWKLYNTVQKALMRAHRCCNMNDMWNPQRSVLETLTREMSTMRVRDIHHGEEVRSIWDDIMRGRTVPLDLEKKGISNESWAENSFYGEADAMEDAVLFPDGNSTTKAKSTFKGEHNAIDKFMNKGPDWYRFINDLDTDEEPDEDLSSDEDDHKLTNRGSDRHEWVTAKEAAYTTLCQDALLTPPENDKKGTIAKRAAKNRAALKKAKADSLRLLLTDDQREQLDLLKAWKPPYEYGSNPEKEFGLFMDREKSKAFKSSWHRADMQPGAREKYVAQRELVARIVRYEDANDPFQFVHDLRFVNVHPSKHRLLIRDIRDARAMMLLFFPGHLPSKMRQALEDSRLACQEARSQEPEPRRSHASNPNRPKKFWQEWDTLTSRHGFNLETDIPHEWDVAIRPIIARLYKEGVILNAHLERTPGYAIAAKEPGREYDLYCDYRLNHPDVSMASYVEEPPTRDSFMRSARRFSNAHPEARFALLRLWSAPHFWPLMLGFDGRDMYAFQDARGRSWEWNFCPKDFPGTEKSMHHNAQGRIKPFEHILGERVLVKQDLYLIMGENEEDLLKYATAATFAIIGEPWRLEIDLWRSFVNVDIGFLDNLKEECTTDTYLSILRHKGCPPDSPPITDTIPSSRPHAGIPLRNLTTPSHHPDDEHSAALLDSTDEKRAGRHSSDSAGSDFSLWSDTGDLAEQLADEEDPLQIRLRQSGDETFRRRSGQGHRSRPHKEVHYAPENHLHRKTTHPGLDKEAIQIPEPPPRVIGRTEKILATIMTGKVGSHGLTGKPLVYFTSVFVSTGVFIFGYDQGVMSGIITGSFFKDYFNQPTRAEIGTMVAILEIGALISSLGVGRIGDMIGRRKTIFYGSIIFFVGGALQTFANGMPMMILGRVIAGLGVGALSTIVPVYQSEISPPHNRGKLACIEFSGNILGYMFSVWVDYFCSFIMSDYSWRVPLMLQCVMGALLGAGSLIICESPRWLLDNDHDEEGIVVIANLYGGGDIHNDKARQEYRDIKMNVLLQRQEGERTYYEMFRKYHKRLFIAMSAQALAQLNGINVISYYAPLVFESAGWVGRDAILMTGINGITYFASTIPPWYLVDRWGRRIILLSGALAMIVSLSLISYFIFIDVRYTPLFTVVFVMIYNAAFGASWGPIPWLYPPEILPLSIRAKGASLSTASNWACNWVVGEMTPILQEWITWRLYLVHAFFCAVSFVLVYFIYPETANVRLEDMDAIFGDATTAMPTPAQHAEVDSLMSGRSPVPSLDIRRNQYGHLGADNAIPGLDINPPNEDKVQEETRSEGIGGWISRLASRNRANGKGSKDAGNYKRIDQEDD